MDNFTHSLIGITLAQSLDLRGGGSRKPAAVDRRMLWTAIIGNNLPDIDFVVPPWMSFVQGWDTTLAYLLHHRGHTHTVGWLPVFGLLAAAAGCWLGRKDSIPFSWRTFWKRWAPLGLLSVAFHLFADSWNEYGVHPFHPFHSSWIYGDSVFIIEPGLWFASIPLAVMTCRTRWAKAAWASVGVIMAAMVWLSPFVQWPAAFAITLWGAFACGAYFRTANPRLVLGLLLALVGFQFVASSQAWRETQLDRERRFPGEKFLETALSPLPANPSCWRVLTVSRTGADYVARVGFLSLVPNIFTPAGCETLGIAEQTAPLLSLPASEASTDASGSSKIAWLREFRAPWSELETLRNESCAMRGLLHFARIPFWTRRSGRWIAGDLRYDREVELGFAELDLTEADLRMNGRPCPDPFVPWGPVLNFSEGDSHAQAF